MIWLLKDSFRKSELNSFQNIYPNNTKSFLRHEAHMNDQCQFRKLYLQFHNPVSTETTYIRSVIALLTDIDGIIPSILSISSIFSLFRSAKTVSEEEFLSFLWFHSPDDFIFNHFPGIGVHQSFRCLFIELLFDQFIGINQTQWPIFIVGIRSDET